ncbi:MAG: SsgA family sporulation/cell division regulator [Marmoricola sp.]
MDKPSRSTATTVRAMVPFISGETQSELLEGELVFDLSDPYAVAMHLEARSGTVIWTFARELLAEGLYTPSGNGDVQVWPCLSSTGDAVVIIELSSPDGLALLQAPSRTVHDFVARTHEVVPEGEETSHLAMDAMISQLLGH